MAIYVNKQLVRVFNFPGGECQVKLTNTFLACDTYILAELNSSNDIMQLMLTVDAARRMGAGSIYLTIPYFPYSRQDRVCNPGEALSVKVMADLINSLGCAKVIIRDPHSDVTPALINNCKVVELANLIKSVPSTLLQLLSASLSLVAPDAGAEKKVRKLARAFASDWDFKGNVICATKVRDTLTGDITSTRVNDDVTGQDLIVIDDICDGGRTFIALSKALKDAGAGKIYLYVTHGIFSSGLGSLSSHFEHIYCYQTVGGARYTNSSFLTILNEED